jgi:two-component system, response regulator PdtaR
MVRFEGILLSAVRGASNTFNLHMLGERYPSSIPMPLVDESDKVDDYPCRVYLYLGKTRGVFRSKRRIMVENAKILIVEDDATTALILRRGLEKFGCTVSAIVESGKDALDAALEHDPDIVFMDIMLAGEMDGIDTAREIKEYCETAVIFLTAQADPAIQKRASEVGPKGYIIKPIDFETLKKAVALGMGEAT